MDVMVLATLSQIATKTSHCSHCVGVSVAGIQKDSKTIHSKGQLRCGVGDTEGCVVGNIRANTERSQPLHTISQKPRSEILLVQLVFGIPFYYRFNSVLRTYYVVLYIV